MLVMIQRGGSEKKAEKNDTTCQRILGKIPSTKSETRFRIYEHCAVNVSR